MKSQKNKRSVTNDEVKQLPDSKFDNKEPKKINSYKNYFV